MGSVCTIRPAQTEAYNSWYPGIVDYLMDLDVPKELTRSEKRKITLAASKFCLIEGVLFKRSLDGILRRCLLPEETLAVLTELHDSACGGHFAGRLTSDKILRAGYWWPTIIKDSFQYAKKCDACQRSTRGDNRLRPLQPIFA